VGIQLWRTQTARWANDKFGGSRSPARSGQLADVQPWLTLRMVGRRQGRRMALARGQHHGVAPPARWASSLAIYMCAVRGEANNEIRSFNDAWETANSPASRFVGPLLRIYPIILALSLTAGARRELKGLRRAHMHGGFVVRRGLVTPSSVAPARGTRTRMRFMQHASTVLTLFSAPSLGPWHDESARLQRCAGKKRAAA
jgi:hypothetical protein